MGSRTGDDDLHVSWRPGDRVAARLGIVVAPLALAMLALAACAGDAEPEPMTQEEYQEAASAFEAERARYAQEVVACAAERGIEAQTTWDHGVTRPASLDDAAAERYWDVVQACAERVYPPERELGADEIEQQYRLLLAARECLRREGHEVSEPTGLDAFVTAYESGGAGPPWSPYADVATDVATFRRAVEACPQPGRY